MKRTTLVIALAISLVPTLVSAQQGSRTVFDVENSELYSFNVYIKATLSKYFSSKLSKVADGRTTLMADDDLDVAIDTYNSQVIFYRAATLRDIVPNGTSRSMVLMFDNHHPITVDRNDANNYLLSLPIGDTVVVSYMPNIAKRGMRELGYGRGLEPRYRSVEPLEDGTVIKDFSSLTK